MESPSVGARGSRLAVIVAALGYFVDIYDLVLFGVVRRASLLGIGVPEDQIQSVGIVLLDLQMAGMLVGGILWGILGDKRGRLSVLFGSILLYSLANVANGFVQDVMTYGVLRFVAGVGLAGELGAGITLVSEVTDRHLRGWATTIVAAIGISGAVAAALVGEAFEWRTSYFVGGGLGLALLVLRVGVMESGMFSRARDQAVVRGSFFALFAKPARLVRYLAVVVVGVPIWYAVGILVILSPEVGRAMGMSEPPSAGRAILWCYVGLALGDLASGALSQVLRSRRRALGVFLGLTAAAMLAYFTLGAGSLTRFYVCAGLLGFATGYWAVFVTVAAEQFGTNLRATATTTVPNFVRGAVVPLTASFHGLAGPLGTVESAVTVGVVVLALAVVALRFLDETYGKDLDFLE